MARPTFFFSHARRDAELPGRYLLRFFEDLEDRIAAWSPQERPYGTIDRRIDHGADWDAVLSGALAANTAFLAVLTPLYGTRENCGKELGVFLMRSRSLRLDDSGQVSGIENVLPIQWMPRSAYAVNAERDALIPAVLRRVEDAPADPMDDAEVSKAIQRYRQHGMERCVSPGTRYYHVLLDVFAKRIVSLPELPPAPPATFAVAIDAFRNDWRKVLGGQSPVATLTATLNTSLPPNALRPLESLVVFHATDRAFQAASSSAGFGFALIADPEAEPDAHTDTVLAQLLDDVRSAAVEVKMTPVHASSPAADLAKTLAELSARHVLVAVMLDRPAAPDDEVLAALRSAPWRGAVFRTSRAGPVAAQGEYAMPDDRPARRALMRSVFVEMRGAALRAGDNRSANAERLPLLRSSVGGSA